MTRPEDWTPVSRTRVAKTLLIWPMTRLPLILTYKYKRIVIIIILLVQSFPPVFTGGLSREFEWHQVPQITRSLLNMLPNLNAIIYVALNLGFENPLVFSLVRWRLFEKHQLQLLTSSCSTAFLVLNKNPSICLSFRFLLSPHGDLLEQQHLRVSKFFFFLSSTRSGFMGEIRGSFCISKSKRF